LGSDLTVFATLQPGDIPGLLTAVASTYGKIVASDFPKRADALAEQIAERGPDLIALQEAVVIRRQHPGDGLQTLATDVVIDYVDVLLAALESHGLHYRVVSHVDESDFEVPLATSLTTFDDLRLTDRDVILARADVPPGFLLTSNAQGANYQFGVPLGIGGTVKRGWCSVDVMVRGRQFRLINTHLEDALPPPFPNIQGAQALELIGGPAQTTLPVILAGDFNSDANGQYSSATYGLLTAGANFSDAWSDVHPGAPGLTWGHDELLANPGVPFVLRIDLILYRGRGLHAVGAEVVDPPIGAAPPRWSSDHARVFTGFEID
jgi:endonuclease/exonuclease/phosphatase family metal-dependent hydrolase